MSLAASLTRRAPPAAALVVHSLCARAAVPTHPLCSHSSALGAPRVSQCLRASDVRRPNVQQMAAIATEDTKKLADSDDAVKEAKHKVKVVEEKEEEEELPVLHVML